MSYKNKRWEDSLPENETVKEKKESLNKEIDKVIKEIADPDGLEVKYAPGFIDDMSRLFGKSPYRRLMRGIGNVRRFPREVKWFIQRGRRGYSDQDVWDMHSYLDSIIPPMLRELADMAHGHPCNPFDEIGCEFHVLDKDKEEDDEDGVKNRVELPDDATEAWKKRLRDMADKMENAKNIDEMKFMEDDEGNDIDDPKVWMPRREAMVKELKEGFGLLEKWWFALWD